MAKITRLPWKVYIAEHVTEIQDENSKAVVSWMGFDESDIKRATHNANARMIVEAVNNYAAILEALERIAAGNPGNPNKPDTMLSDKEMANIAREALAKR